MFQKVTDATQDLAPTHSGLTGAAVPKPVTEETMYATGNTHADGPTNSDEIFSFRKVPDVELMVRGRSSPTIRNVHHLAPVEVWSKLDNTNVPTRSTVKVLHVVTKAIGSSGQPGHTAQLPVSVGIKIVDAATNVIVTWMLNSEIVGRLESGKSGQIGRLVQKHVSVEIDLEHDSINAEHKQYWLIHQFHQLGKWKRKCVEHQVSGPCGDTGPDVPRLAAAG